MRATKQAPRVAAGRQEVKPRQDCVRDAVPSVRIEGGQVDGDAARILPEPMDGAARKRRAALERAEASLALEGLRPSGPFYDWLRVDVIAGRVSLAQAVAEVSASFGPDIE